MKIKTRHAMPSATSSPKTRSPLKGIKALKSELYGLKRRQGRFSPFSSTYHDFTIRIDEIEKELREQQ